MAFIYTIISIPLAFYVLDVYCACPIPCGIMSRQLKFLGFALDDTLIASLYNVKNSIDNEPFEGMPPSLSTFMGLFEEEHP